MSSLTGLKICAIVFCGVNAYSVPQVFMINSFMRKFRHYYADIEEHIRIILTCGSLMATFTTALAK